MRLKLHSPNFLVLVLTTFCLGQSTSGKKVAGREFAASQLETCSSCGDGWVKYNDQKCFKILSKFLDKDQAARNCQNEGSCGGSNGHSHLASIKSLEEQLFLTHLLIKTETNVWIGAERSSSNKNNFVWQDGSELNFTNWAEGNPSQNDDKFVQMRFQSGIPGEWVNVPCSEKSYALCQKSPNLGGDKLYEMVVELRNELSNTRTDLENTKTDLSVTKTDLNSTRVKLENRIEERVVGIEGAFQTSFEVDGDVNFYYPVAIELASENYFLRSPIAYDIYRAYFEKAPESLNTDIQHYMALTLKLLASDGYWDAGSNQAKVMFHDWIYNKGVAKVQLFHQQEGRLFVWLRGGGVLYHIRSPVDLSNAITVFYEENAITSPAVDSGTVVYPANIVNPIPVGSEDVNLVRPGNYSGWGF